MLILIVASGPDKGKIYELKGDRPVVLGREGDQVKLSDSKVSRKHAQLTCEGGCWYLKDLDSRHGTYRNHKPLTGKSQVKDGDYLQIGKTVMVASRMQVEQAERLALLGDSSGWMEPPKLQRSRWRPSLTAAALLLGAAGIVGLNFFQYHHSTQQTRALEQQLADARAQADTSAQQLLTQVQQIAPSDAQPILKEILASVNASQQQARTLEEIQSALANLPRTQELRPALDTILEQLQAQPQREADQLARLLETLESQPDHTQPILEQLALSTQLAQTQQQTMEHIRQSIAQSNDQVTRAIAEAAQAQQQQQTQALAAMLEQVNNQPTYDAQFDQLRQLIQAQPTRLESLLAQNDSDPDAADAIDKLYLELAALGTRLPENLAQQLDHLVTQLDAQPSPDRLAQAVAQVVTDHPDRLSPAIEQLAQRLAEQPTAQELADTLRATLETQPDPVTPALEKLLAQLETQARTQATPEQLAQAVAQVLQNQPDPVTPALDALAAKLDQQQPLGRDQILAAVASAQQAADAKLMQRLDQLASAVQASAQASDASEDTASLLALQSQTTTLLNQVLAEVQNRQPIDQLRQQLQTLADASTSSANDGRLNEILEALATRQQADVTLNQLAEQLALWPTQNQQALAQILDQLHRRDAAMADTVRAQVRQSLADTQLTFQPMAQQAPASSPPANATRQLTTTPATVASRPSRSPHRAAPPLTPVEEAYRIAFETGQPLTIGAGVKNPVTGEVSRGRQLDPVAAKAAGMTTWRQWYLADDFAQRMRLQRAASEHLKDTAAAKDVLRLPTSR